MMAVTFSGQQTVLLYMEILCTIGELSGVTHTLNMSFQR